MADAHAVRGCCPLDCQDSCSWVAHIEEGRVTRVEGARDHPFTRGALCAKVNDYPARTYAPDRLLHPLRRVGPKGAGAFERISWDEALDEIATRFRSIVDTYGGEALLPYHYVGSMGIVQRRALMRVFHALGASRFHGSVCGAAGNVIAKEGHPRGFDPEDLVHARMVLLWGANLLTTCHHHFHVLDEARKHSGARIVAIDPRRTRTADRCDEHLPIRPGTDRFLAAGFAHVMFAEDLIDFEFAGSVAMDFDALRSEVESWTPERTATATGIPAETIVRIAREFGAAKPAVIRAGVGLQQSRDGESVMRGLSALAILGGHWRYLGGGLFGEASPELDEKAAERRDLAPGTTRSLDMARLAETLTDLDPPIKGLMVWCANPITAQIDTVRMLDGLRREDLFTVVIEHFVNDMARHADIVLPSTTQLEHFDIQGAWGHHYISVNHPAIAPLGESKSHGEMMRLLAARMGLDDPAFRESDEEIAAAALPEGVTLDALKATGWVKMSPPAPDFDAIRVRVSGFTTGAPQTPNSGALRLLTPKSHWFMNSSFVNMPRQRRAMERPTLELHPDDARTRGIADGATIEIRNERGRVFARARITDAIVRGAVALEGKWWLEPVETGATGNLLTSSVWSPGGQPAYNDTWVMVMPVTKVSWTAGSEDALAPLAPGP